MKLGYRELPDHEREQLLKELGVYGYCVIKDYIEPEDVSFLKGHVEDLWAEGSVYEGVPDRDIEDRIVYNLQNKDKERNGWRFLKKSFDNSSRLSNQFS